MSIKALKSSKDKSINKYIFAFLCILVFYPPFFRGLFFTKELIITHMLTFALFTLWMITELKSKDRVIINSTQDLIAVAIALMFFLSIFYGANKQTSVYEFLKYANYIMIYLLVRNFTKANNNYKGIIIDILLYSGVIVAFIGIGSAIGTFNYNGAFISGRINSTFQYPNTLAAYLFAIFILAIGQLQTIEKSKYKYIYTMFSNVFIFTFILTLSRGMWIFAPIIYIIYYIAIPKDKKVDLIINTIISVVPAVLFSFLFTRTIENGSGLYSWLVFIMSILSSSGLLYITNKKFIKAIENISPKIINYFLIAGAFLIIAFGIIAFNITEPIVLSNIESQQDAYKYIDRNVNNIDEDHGYELITEVETTNSNNKPYSGNIVIYSIGDEGKTTVILNETINESNTKTLSFKTQNDTRAIKVRFGNYYTETEVKYNNAKIIDGQTKELIDEIKMEYKFIPENIITRISSMTSSEESVQSRFSFYKDAMKIIKKSPIFGFGGGAWKTLYQMYQSYGYNTTEAHNYFMQLWIEVGIIGLLLFTGLIIMLIFNTYKMIQEENVNIMEKIRHISITLAWFTIIVHSTIDFDLSLGAIAIFTWTLFAMNKQKDISFKTSINNKKVYIKYIAMSISLLLTIGSISLYTGQAYAQKAIKAAQKNNIEEALNYFESAKKFDPYTSNYRVDLATVYSMLIESNRDFQNKAKAEMNKAIDINPYDGRILQKAGQLYLQLGEVEEGLNYMDEAVRAKPMKTSSYIDQTNIYISFFQYLMKNNKNDELKYVITKMEDLQEFLIKASQKSILPFENSEALNRNLQKINYIIDNKDNIEELKRLDELITYNKFNMDIDRDGLPDGTRITNGEEGELIANNIQNKEYIELVNNGAQEGIYWIDSIALEPNKSYNIQLEYKSNIEPDNLDMYIYDYTNGTKTIGSIENIKQSEEFTQLETSLKTPENIEIKNQKIGIVHRGTGGEVSINRLTIFRN